MKKKIRFISANIIAQLLIAFGLVRKMRKKALGGEFILSIYFHSPSKSLFEFCITWLKKNEFQFLSQEDMLNIANNSKPFPKAAVIITIDDGWQSNKANVVEVANKYQIPITIFISTDPVEIGNFWWSCVENAQEGKSPKYSIEALKQIPNSERMQIIDKLKTGFVQKREALTVAEVKEIASSELVTIGGHTSTHPILTRCDDDEVFEELTLSKEKLQHWVDSEIYSFAYPNGDYGHREVALLRKYGYKIAYTTEASYLNKEKLNSLYELPRFCVFENISRPEAICRMLGVWQRFIN